MHPSEESPQQPVSTKQRSAWWDRSGAFHDVGMVAGSLWGLLLFLAIGLTVSSGGRSGEEVPWLLLLAGSAAFVGGIVTWMGEEGTPKRYPVAIGLAIVAGGMVAAWFPLASGTATGRSADVAAIALVLGLAASGLLILPCLGAIAVPTSPMAGAARMCVFALFGFVASWVLLYFQLADGLVASLAAVLAAGCLAGLDGYRRIPSEARGVWLVCNLTGVAVMHLTLLLVFATILAAEPL